MSSLSRLARYHAARLRRLPVRLRYAGDDVLCPVCDGSFRGFVPFGPSRPAARCPGCGALERHRGLALWLNREMGIGERPQALLHIAPEPPLQRRLSRLARLRYTTFDLDSPYADVHGDIQALPFADRAFDAAVCSHVLEHVADDRAGLRELRRVLKPSGWAAVLVPIDPARSQTDEDPSVVDPEERRRRFGQSDHVRMYGADFADRVRELGLAVREESWIRDRDPETRRRYGLGDDTIYLCRPA